MLSSAAAAMKPSTRRRGLRGTKEADHAQGDAPVGAGSLHGLGQQKSAEQQQDQGRPVGLADLRRRQHAGQGKHRQGQQRRHRNRQGLETSTTHMQVTAPRPAPVTADRRSDRPRKAQGRAPTSSARGTGKQRQRCAANPDDAAADALTERRSNAESGARSRDRHGAGILSQCQSCPCKAISRNAVATWSVPAAPSTLRRHDPPLTDRFGRRVDYLRLSVTDRCDFRCVYCMAEDMQFAPKARS
jgi:hypothetical protein